MRGVDIKKIILLMTSLLLLSSIFTGCSSQDVSSSTRNQTNLSEASDDIRQLAFEQLASEDKDSIKGTCRDSKLSTITLNENMGIINDKSYIGKEVYLVNFPTKSKSMPNNTIFYISKDTHKLIGAGYVE
jgi:hypothetical protein